MDNIKLRMVYAKTDFIILVKKDNVIKGIVKNSNNYLECSVIPSKMKRFSSVDTARKYFNDVYEQHGSIELVDIKQLKITYELGVG